MSAGHDIDAVSEIESYDASRSDRHASKGRKTPAVIQCRSKMAPLIRSLDLLFRTRLNSSLNDADRKRQYRYKIRADQYLHVSA